MTTQLLAMIVGFVVVLFLFEVACRLVWVTYIRHRITRRRKRLDQWQFPGGRRW